jgi:hypothetical protein
MCVRTGNACVYIYITQTDYSSALIVEEAAEKR